MTVLCVPSQAEIDEERAKVLGPTRQPVKQRKTYAMLKERLRNAVSRICRICLRRIWRICMQHIRHIYDICGSVVCVVCLYDIYDIYTAAGEAAQDVCHAQGTPPKCGESYVSYMFTTYICMQRIRHIYEICVYVVYVVFLHDIYDTYTATG